VVDAHPVPRQHQELVAPGTTPDHQRGQRELAIELLLPLLHEPRGSQDERLVGQRPHAQLAEDEPGLDRLAHPDLVGEDRATPHLTQHARRRPELVGERLEAQPRQ
jgi:hypothetical protein